MNPFRGLLVLGVNHLLQEGAISLVADPSDDEREPGTGHHVKRGHVFAELAGLPAVTIWNHIGFQEVSVAVWWDYHHDRHPQRETEHFQSLEPLAKRERYRDFVGVTVSGWLERKTGCYLMGQERDSLLHIYARKDMGEKLETLRSAEPVGYKATGKFFV